MQMHPHASKTRTRARAALIGLLALGLIGCGGRDPDPGHERGPKKGGVLTISNGAEPRTVDPGKVTDSVGFIIAYSLFEGLLIERPEDLSIQPGIAESWEVSDDGLVYTFRLRQSAWSDGRPLTAEDFLWSWLRVLDPVNECEYAYQLYYIKNAEPYYRREITDPDLVGITVVDPHTLQVVLERPTPFFPSLAAFTTYLPVPRHAVEAHGDRWTQPGNIVVNGPFAMTSWRINMHVAVEPNPRYWDRDSVRLDKIVFLASDDHVTSLKKYEEGETDWVRTVPLAYVEQMMDRDDFHISPFFSTYYYRFNVTRPPLDDVRVRKALNKAVDKTRIVRHVTRAGERATSGFVPPGIPGYQGADGLDHDPAGARKLLAEAGYPEGRGFPPLELKYNTSDAHKAIAEAIQEMWRNELDIRVQLVNVEWKTLLADRSAMNYQIMRSGWIGDYMDPNTFLDMFVTGGGNNHTGWTDPEYDALIEQAARTQDPERRFELFRRAEQILVEEAVPILPLYIYVNKNMLNPRVGGVGFNLKSHHLMKYAYIKD